MSAAEWREVTVSAAKMAVTLDELGDLVAAAVRAGCPGSAKLRGRPSIASEGISQVTLRWQPKVELVSDDGE